MSNRKKHKQQRPEITKQADYYKLKTQAVEDLASADESNSPEVSEEELKKYRSSSGIKFPDWAKMLLIKFYFPGAVCFFFIWGLGNMVADQLDLLFITGIAMGVVTEMITNNVIRFFERTPGGNNRWMMLPSKKYYTFILNILYAFVVLALVYGTYNVINMALIAITGAVDTVPLGVEPILFGVFYCGYDMLLIQAKLALLRLFRGGKKAAR